MEIKTEDTQLLIEKFRKSGFDLSGDLNITTGGQSLTDGDRSEFIARFIIDLTSNVPDIIHGNDISVEFFDYPPNKLTIEFNKRDARIKILDYQTGEPINDSIPECGLKIGKDELVAEIMIAAYKIRTVDRISSIDSHEPTRHQIDESISSAEQAIDKSEF